MTPEELYGIVERYSSFGDHRTGSSADRATAAWFALELAERGCTPEVEHFGFDRFRVDASLGDLAIAPVWYSAVGDYEGPVQRAPFPGPGPGAAAALDNGGDVALAMVIDGPPGEPVAVNQPIRAPGRTPIVIVPGDADPEGEVLRWTARIEPGRAANVTAVGGAPDGAPVTVTTPLSGWGPCAGERGTGIAITLDLVEQLVATHRVTVVACSGHELDHHGLEVWFDTHPLPAGPVIHIGASTAAVDTNRRTLREPEVGEGHNWFGRGADVLSFVGTFPLFHTPGDTPGEATSPELLESARDDVFADVDSYLT